MHEPTSAPAGSHSARSADPARPSRRILEPIDRISETLFGLIMVLTFTGSLSIAEAQRDDVRTMLIAALGCNMAWGIIDALFYLMGCLADRGQRLRALHAVRSSTDPDRARQLVADALPPLVASVMQPSELDSIRRRLLQLPDPPARAGLTRHDLLGGVSVFLWVFLSTFPVVIPFIVMSSAAPALRVSNLIAIAMLFLAGHAYGRVAGHKPWLMGVAMVIIGSVLVGLTMMLGG